MKKIFYIVFIYSCITFFISILTGYYNKNAVNELIVIFNPLIIFTGNFTPNNASLLAQFIEGIFLSLLGGIYFVIICGLIIEKELFLKIAGFVFLLPYVLLELFLAVFYAFYLMGFLVK
ncbi:MAG: hypothetical protein R3Y11_05045 [Pseudomonadota bacterium]